MKVLVLAGYFLVCVALAHAGLEDFLESVDESFDDTEEFDANTFSETDDLFVFDDEGNLVELDSNDDDVAEEDESVEETASKISKRVIFHLYTAQNPTNYEIISVNDTASLSASSFDPTKPLRIITHGWVNSKNSDACTLLVDAYLAHGDYNVIVVDWSKISKRPYIYASNRVKIVGIYVAELLNFLERQGADLSETVLAGHSLGAHIVGLAGYYANGVVEHIVGLDPALPLFYTSKAGSRIAKGDAKHVQIIHTNAGLLGYYSAIGDSDFYPNGGGSQRGCIIDVGGSCSHSRAYKYFAESINSKTGFYGRQCKYHWLYNMGMCGGNRLGLMGGSKPADDVRGVYYLTTSRKSPYAKG